MNDKPKPPTTSTTSTTSTTTPGAPGAAAAQPASPAPSTSSTAASAATATSAPVAPSATTVPATPSADGTASAATASAATSAATAATPTASTNPFLPVSADEIAAFADKLAQSGANLSPAEQALLNMIVDEARAITPEDVRAQELRQGFTVALRGVVAAQAQAWGTDTPPDGWVRIDPIWMRSDDTGAMAVSATIVMGPAQTAGQAT